MTPSVARAASIVPGLGHLLLGLVGTGLARMLLWALWLGGGVALLRGGALGPGLVLLIGAVVLWLATAADVALVTPDASGPPRQLLDARRLAVLAVVVTGGLILTATVVVLGSS